MGRSWRWWLRRGGQLLVQCIIARKGSSGGRSESDPFDSAIHPFTPGSHDPVVHPFTPGSQGRSGHPEGEAHSQVSGPPGKHRIIQDCVSY